MNPSPEARFPRSIVGKSTAAIAFAVGSANLALSVFVVFSNAQLLQAAATGNLPLSAEIAGVLGLQCTGAHATGLLIAWSRGESQVTSLLTVAFLSLILSWVGLFNIQVVLAPSFTFTVGPVVMTNSYIAVVFTYAACALISIGFIFLNMRLSKTDTLDRQSAKKTLSAEEFSMVAAGVQGLIFVGLGMMAGI